MLHTFLHARFDCLLHSLLALFFLITSQNSTEAATWYLKPGGTGTGNSWTEAAGKIQTAINFASAEDEIWVASGTYNEAITMATGIALYGGFLGIETAREQRNWSAHPTVITSEGISSYVVTVSTEITVLDGLVFTGGSEGVDYSYVSSSTLTNCVMSGNSDCGVSCNHSSPTLINCTIAGNSPSHPKATTSGLRCFNNSSATLVNCILVNQGGEIQTIKSSPVVTYCCIQGGYPGTGNIDSDPLFVDIENGNYQLQDGSPCIDAGINQGLTFNGSAPDMGAWESPSGYSQGLPRTPSIRYVNGSAPSGGDGKSWQTAFQEIPSTPWWTFTGDEIWVAKGIYHQAITPTSGLGIYGGFMGTEIQRNQRDWISNPTIITGSELPTRVVSMIEEATTLDGLTITGSTAGGVLYSYVSSSTMANCNISGNSASEGGGVYIGYSSPALFNCTLSTNYAEGTGGGCCITYTSNPTLRNCTISENSSKYATGGLCIRYNSSPIITNCLISNNSSLKTCGGVDFYTSSPTLINCTIAKNTGNSNGGISFDYYSTPTLLNCILWNSGDEVHCDYWPNNAVLSYCCVEGGYAGTGNISDDPLFVDAVNGDFHLQELSPCIDKGAGPVLNSLVPLSDMDGDPRSGSSCDIGADECLATTRIRDWENY